MKRTLAILAVVLLACPFAACGGGGGGEADPVESYVPTSGEVSGWTEDTAAANNGAAGAEVCREAVGIPDFIDGAIDPFVDTGAWVAVAWEFYTNGTNTLELRLYEMGNASACQEVYDYLATHPEGVAWQAASLGDAGRTADQGPYWKTHARKGNYFVETFTFPGDEPTQQIAVDFVGAVLAGLP
ncbi:MAG TPA: hypothetical protein PK668_12335 [Myxococcota bacterium]|nr:hypothetical protein [Myxococcota bacterium]HRY93743.1 hypothetical protein [Myxococcota bacterium]HSA22550.1 hypothetical protein [Myxococcota bacterium]